jgi:hypothetical protein
VRAADESGSPDRFELAGRFFTMVWALAFAAALVVVAGVSFRGRDDRAALVEDLGLSDLAFVPAGRPPRHPPPAAIDLRFTPRLLGER